MLWSYLPTDCALVRHYSQLLPERPIKPVLGRIPKQWSSELWVIPFTDQVLDIAFSPEGSYLAARGIGGQIAVYHADSGSPLCSGLMYEGHTECVNAVAFSPCGGTLATGSENGTVIFWDVIGWNPKGPAVPCEGGGIGALAYLPDGQNIAWGSSDGSITIWNVETHSVRGHRLYGHTGRVRALVMSPNDSVLASVSDDCAICLWDPATFQILSTLKTPDRPVTSIAFSPDDNVLFSATSNGLILQWDITTGSPLTQDNPMHADVDINCIAISPAGDAVIAGCDGGTLRSWHAATGVPQGVVRKNVKWQPISFLRFSPNGRQIAFGHKKCVVELWNPDSILLSDADNTTWGPKGTHVAAISSDGGMIASAESDAEDVVIRFWDAVTGQIRGATSKVHALCVNCLDFSPDGKTLAMGGTDPRVSLFDVITGEETCSPLEGHTNVVLTVQFSPDGQILASGSWDATVRLWSIETLTCVGVLAHSGQLNAYSLSFSADGKTLAVHLSDFLNDSADKCHLWDLQTHKELCTPFPIYSSFGVAFSGESTVVARDTAWDVSEVLKGKSSEATRVNVKEAMRVAMHSSRTIRLYIGRDGWIEVGGARWLWVPTDYGRDVLCWWKKPHLLSQWELRKLFVDLDRIPV